MKQLALSERELTYGDRETIIARMNYLNQHEDYGILIDMLVDAMDWWSKTVADEA